MLNFEEMENEYKGMKREISKYEFMDATSDVMASEVFIGLMKIDPTLMMTLTMFTCEVANVLFKENKEEV
jgi:hypothetical protein